MSPREVKAGRSVEVQVRGFAPNSKVTVNLFNKKTNVTTFFATVDVKSKGRGNVKVSAPAKGDYKVVVVGSNAKSNLRVK